jgi:hypothetical protein
MVHGSWTNGALGSTVDRSGVRTGATVVHGRGTAHRGRSSDGGRCDGDEDREGGASAWEERKMRGDCGQ